MWTSGVTPAGSSSVPPRTNRTPGCPYWLKTATLQVGQRKIRWVLPSSRGTSTGCGSPASNSIRAAAPGALLQTDVDVVGLAIVESDADAIELADFVLRRLPVEDVLLT